MTDTFSSASAPHTGGAQPDSQPADDVTSALAELERKLRELERELASIGRRRARPEEAGGDTSPPPTGRLIDEQVEAEPPVEDAAVEWATPAERATPVEEHRAMAEPMSPSDAQLAGLAELRRFRDRVERFAKELTDDYDAMLGRVMAGLSGRSAGEPTAPAGPEEILFEGRVELGVGPFYDIASLSAFEQSLASIPSVSEVAVRRFEASHAVVDLRLATPTSLVSELRSALQADFSVRQVAEGRMLLTFDDA